MVNRAFSRTATGRRTSPSRSHSDPRQGRHPLDRAPPGARSGSDSGDLKFHPDPAMFVPSEDWINAFNAQCTEELWKKLEQFAARCARGVGKGGGVVDDYYVRELVQDALADTRLGVLRRSHRARTMPAATRSGTRGSRSMPSTRTRRTRRWRPSMRHSWTGGRRLSTRQRFT